MLPGRISSGVVRRAPLGHTPLKHYMHDPIRRSQRHRTSKAQYYSLVAEMVVKADDAAKEAVVCLPILLQQPLRDKPSLCRRPGQV